jgi:hypothetical protein
MDNRSFQPMRRCKMSNYVCPCRLRTFYNQHDKYEQQECSVGRRKETLAHPNPAHWYGYTEYVQGCGTDLETSFIPNVWARSTLIEPRGTTTYDDNLKMKMTEVTLAMACARTAYH